MSLIPTIYSSTDPGAPQLTGQVGSLISLLRALLVTGYGISPNQKAPLGWTEEFTGTNIAVFRNNPVSGTGYYTRVVDDGSAAAGGSARSATLRAFSSMSDIDTGLDPTPTPTQWPNGALWPKSTLLDATPRAWWAIGNERCLYLFIDCGGITLLGASPCFLGDLVPFKAGDAHHFMVSYTGNSSYNGTTSVAHSKMFVGGQRWNVNPTNSNLGACGYVGRMNSQAPGAALLQTASPADGGTVSYGGDNSGLPYPYQDIGLVLDRAMLIEAAWSLRGMYPGLWVPLHQRPFSDLAQIPDVTAAGGATLVCKRFRGFYIHVNSYDGEVLFDVTNPW